jgi:hypothetical protein
MSIILNSADRLKNMAENRAHSESYNKRLDRFESGDPEETIGTLLNSIGNFFNNEIEVTRQNKQTSLVFLGTHAAILTISEALFNKVGIDGYKYFVKQFMDGNSEDLQFSRIASMIHDWRNILAHQWLGKTGHSFGYNYEMKEGWKDVDGVIFVNPSVYCKQYLKAFSSESELWDYQSYLDVTQLQAAKDRIICKFIKN